jgi:hypothetical protein
MSTHIIAIAGPSCVGKTELAKRLARSLSAIILPMDAYYRDLAFLPLESRSKFNFDLRSLARVHSALLDIFPLPAAHPYGAPGRRKTRRQEQKPQSPGLLNAGTRLF